MADMKKSPATISTTAFTFPDRKFSKLTIKVESTSGKTVYISDVPGETVASGLATHVLYSGEAIEFDGQDYKSANEISIVAAGSTVVFWSLK